MPNLSLTRARLYELTYYHGRRHDDALVAFLFDLLSNNRSRPTLLDCACGTGEPGLHLAPFFDTTFSDSSPEMLEIAREKARHMEINKRFIQVAWRDLPTVIPDRFDLVMCAGGAISQVEDREELCRSLEGMTRMLSSSGVLYLDFISEWPRLTKGRYNYCGSVGPLRWNGELLLILIHERVTQTRIDRIKTCLSVTEPRPQKLSTVRSSTTRIYQAELEADLASLGFSEVTAGKRPGRWPMTYLVARH